MRKITMVLTFVLLCSAILYAAGVKDAPPVATGEPTTLIVWCSAVHQQTAEGVKGGLQSQAKTFEEKFNVKIEWVPIAWNQMQDKVMRELALSSGSADVIFIVNDWASESLLNSFESLGSYIAKSPVRDLEDIALPMREVFSIKNDLKALPYRSNPQILHYNKAHFAANGVENPPASFEELIQIAAKTTFKRADGAQVYGLGIKKADDIISVVKAYGGDVLTTDYRIAVKDVQTIKALEALASMYKAGSIPPNFTELVAADYQNLVNEGLLSMILFGDNYYLRFTDAAKSKVVKDMWFAPIPASVSSGLKVAPAKNAFWGAGIPKNSPKEKKQAAYEFVRYFSEKDAQLQMALNGNGPVRTSVFSDETYIREVPYSTVSQVILPTAAPPLPSFEGTLEVTDIFNEKAVEVILGRKSAQAAMQEAADAIQTVLKREGITK